MISFFLKICAVCLFFSIKPSFFKRNDAEASKRLKRKSIPGNKTNAHATQSENIKILDEVQPASSSFDLDDKLERPTKKPKTDLTVVEQETFKKLSEQFNLRLNNFVSEAPFKLISDAIIQSNEKVY